MKLYAGIPTKPYDCDNCILACVYDGLCDWNLHPDYKEGEPLPCERGLEDERA